MAGQSRQLTNWLFWYQVSRLSAVLACLMSFQWQLNHSLIISLCVGLACIHNKHVRLQMSSYGVSSLVSALSSLRADFTLIHSQKSIIDPFGEPSG